MTRQKRAQIQAQILELTSLLNNWDPAALSSAGAPTDEYECLAGPLLSRLAQGSSAGELSEWLRGHIVEHFGSCPEDTEAFARRVMEWFLQSGGGPVQLAAAARGRPCH